MQHCKVPATLLHLWLPKPKRNFKPNLWIANISALRKSALLSQVLPLFLAIHGALPPAQKFDLCRYRDPWNSFGFSHLCHLFVSSRIPHISTYIYISHREKQSLHVPACVVISSIPQLSFDTSKQPVFSFWRWFCSGCDMDIECHSQQLTLHCPSLIWTHGGTPKILSLLLCEGVRLALWLYLVLQTHSDFVGSSHANLSRPNHLNLNVPPLPDIGVPAWYWLPYISGLKVENNWLRKRHSTKDPASMGHWSTCAQSLVRCVLRTVGGLISRAKTLNSKVSWSRKLLNVYKWTKLTTVLVKPPLWFVNGWWWMPSGFLRLKEIARQLQSPSSYPDPSLINSANMCKCCQVTLKVPALVPRIGRPGPFRVGVQAKQQWLKSPAIGEYQIWQNWCQILTLLGVRPCRASRKWCKNMFKNQSMPSDMKLILVKFWSSSCAICALWSRPCRLMQFVHYDPDRADHVYLTLTLFLEAHQGFGPVAVGAACCRSSIVVLARSLDAAVIVQCHAVPCSAMQCRAVPCLLQVWQFILHGNWKNGIDARKVAGNYRSFSDSMARQNMQARTMSTWSRFSSSNCPTFRRQVGQMSVKR